MYICDSMRPDNRLGGENEAELDSRLEGFRRRGRGVVESAPELLGGRTAAETSDGAPHGSLERSLHTCSCLSSCALTTFRKPLVDAPMPPPSSPLRSINDANESNGSSPSLTTFEGNGGGGRGAVALELVELGAGVDWKMRGEAVRDGAWKGSRSDRSTGLSVLLVIAGGDEREKRKQRE